ncbi:MAG: ROK family protein [Chloroflexi bacterium]|nr:ROK family protein [Chloroflexota bacterium]
MSTDKSVAIGVELAGTGASVALVDRRGRVHYRCQARTLRGRPAIATLEPYLRAIEAALAYAHAESLRVRGVGVCVPGSLNAEARRPLLIPTLPSLNDFPLCDFLEARYALPARLHVDVDAALLGEHRFGAGKGFRRLLFLTVNAVVGAALVVDGKLERPQYVGHISHLLVTSNGPRCSCGKRGCINTLISMDAMQKMVQRALRRGEETSLKQRLLNREYFSPQLLAEEAVRGDSVALQVYGEVGRWLSAATAKYISIFEPQILILGGGVLSASDLLLTQVRSELMARSLSNGCGRVEVVSARLGNDAALLGTVVPLF